MRILKFTFGALKVGRLIDELADSLFALLLLALVGVSLLCLVKILLDDILKAPIFSLQPGNLRGKLPLLFRNCFFTCKHFFSQISIFSLEALYLGLHHVLQLFHLGLDGLDRLSLVFGLLLED